MCVIINYHSVFSMWYIIKLYTILRLLVIQNVVTLTIKTDGINLTLEPTSKGINLVASKNDLIKLRGTLGTGNFSHIKCIGNPNCQIDDYSFSTTKLENGFKLKWETKNLKRVFQDCFNLEKGVQWYGGPAISNQRWPVQNIKINGEIPYVVNAGNNIPYAERYWLNSLGVYIYLESKVPLFLDQNNANENKICFSAKIKGPYFNRTRCILEYYLIFKDNPTQAHLHAINYFLGKPLGHPNQKMIEEPIWTTWAKYKTNINDTALIDFATSIRNNGYEGGQIEIDDNWEKCYGAQEFSKKKFSNIQNTVKKLKEMNFRVTLWIHPFVNSNCQNNSNIGVEKGYFVNDKYGRIDGGWWNGDDTGQIDFTNPEAANWWSVRVKKLQENPGVDSFKFDAGETDYCPQPAIYPNVEQEEIPNILTGSYLRKCSTFGSLIEVRTGWKTQDLPIFTRMLDKQSTWDINNGLYTLITTLLLMNAVGYTMILPDMIGGNGYNEITPDAELLVRWTQANTFMPALQFSYLPWEITSREFNAARIVKKYVDLHKAYSGKIINAMKSAVQKGTPVNPPIWWIDPTDNIALACDDEFLLGEEILVAPVIIKGAKSRMVYLPKGTWKDGNNKSYYKGPLTLNYSADITVLPFFILQKNEEK